MAGSRTPTLVVVTGPPGSGKTTLAHAIARAVPCPAICRDEIKEGMVHSVRDFTPAVGDPLTRRTYSTFFDVLELLLTDEVSVVAEAAFQHQAWEPKLERLMDRATLRVVQCHTHPATAEKRILERASQRTAHADTALLESIRAGQDIFATFERLAVPAPSMDVDTTSGLEPDLEAILGFINAEVREPTA